MAEQRLAMVSVEVLLGVPAARRGWAGPGGAERGTGGRPVSHGAASGEMRGRGYTVRLPGTAPSGALLSSLQLWACARTGVFLGVR